MTDKYTDPPNWLTYTDEIREAKTLGDVKAIVDRLYPDLIVGTIPRFSQDYPNLQRNWYKVFEPTKITPTCILIFRTYEPDENHKLVAHIAECFTKAGFLVRTTMDLQPCTICGNALPTQMYHTAMAGKGIALPEWSNKCSSC